MKKTFVLFIVACGLLLTSLPASARYRDHYRGDRYYGNHGHYSGHRHSNNGADVVAGVLVGTMLGAVIAQPAYPSPPPAVVYQPQVVVQQPRVCVEDRTVSGEDQIVNGQKMWVSFPYPVKKSHQVPCY